MNDTELRALVERMVAELAGQSPTPQVKAADYKPLEDAAAQPAQHGGESLPISRKPTCASSIWLKTPKIKRPFWT